MSIDFSKSSHILFFAAFLPALSLGVGWLFVELLPGLPFWVETLSPLAAYGLLYSLFDKIAWRWPLFRWLGIVRTPDVRGRWLGEQVSSFRDKNGKNRRSRVILEINQTFSHISATTYYHKWQSAHSVACFLTIDHIETLMILFESEPKVEYDGTASAHKGVARLQQLPDGYLIGTYFNANGQSGQLTFKRTRYSLHHTFDVVGKE